jgi:hypothetical protein
MKIFQNRNLTPTGKYLIIYQEILLSLSSSSDLTDQEQTKNFIEILALSSRSDFDEPVSLISSFLSLPLLTSSAVGSS